MKSRKNSLLDKIKKKSSKDNIEQQSFNSETNEIESSPKKDERRNSEENKAKQIKENKKRNSIKNNQQLKKKKEENREEFKIVNEKKEGKIEKIEEKEDWGVLESLGVGEDLRLRGEEITIGRSRSCTFRFEEIKPISSIHCKIVKIINRKEPTKFGILMYDLSSNGIELNGRKGKNIKKKENINNFDLILL
jgi:hypothetical protein